MKQSPDFSIESQHSGIICGVDEAGRGPWAGPVVAAAVIWHELDCPITGLNDSKKLSAKARATLYDQIMQHADVGIGEASTEEIYALNILAATKLAMMRAIESLNATPTTALIDGNQPPKHDHVTMIPVVKGDSKSLSIAAASIIAKVTRDRYMQQLCEKHPHYGWSNNAGYGTKQHQEAIAEYGITEHHRRSFAPIRRYLEDQAA
ncbi:MAG: ribonuclease HII [Rickettsiales bacterium]|nr:ribonuclease HII [Rickettsiales bacterium]